MQNQLESKALYITSAEGAQGHKSVVLWCHDYIDQTDDE